ncbi:hypothetical protein BS47DRAFT_1101734 [Hydnum rufescens UP504]|uniref:Uncharacterized protein n=1 Tax=Hydnum rufescens UP504 TaxID=1448309 RepID=A0A9P6AUD9_9AGAM|nr:hypothetical protein BS47DRAFT_1101734 [Hydnum rufescens UP504]
MEQALEIVLTSITELGRSIEEARGASNADHIVEDIQSILSVTRTTTLHGLDIGGGDGVDTILGAQSDDGGTPGPSIFELAPETHEDEANMRNLELSLPSTSSDPAGTRPRVFRDDDLGGEHRLVSPRIASQTSPPSLYNIGRPMPSRKLVSPRRRSVQSPLPSRDLSSKKPSTSIVQRTLPEPPVMPQPVYLHYLHETAGPGWDVALAVTSISEDIPAVPLALTAPLTQVLDVVSGMRDAVNTMGDGKDECTHILFRVLKILHSLVNG